MGCRHLLGTKSSWKMHNIVMTLEKKSEFNRNNVKTVYNETET